jgi:hypothetical protein
VHYRILISFYLKRLLPTRVPRAEQNSPFPNEYQALFGSYFPSTAYTHVYIIISSNSLSRNRTSHKAGFYGVEQLAILDDRWDLLAAEARVKKGDPILAQARVWQRTKRQRSGVSSDGNASLRTCWYRECVCSSITLYCACTGSTLLHLRFEYYNKYCYTGCPILKFGFWQRGTSACPNTTVSAFQSPQMVICADYSHICKQSSKRYAHLCRLRMELS